MIAAIGVLTIAAVVLVWSVRGLYKTCMQWRALRAQRRAEEQQKDQQQMNEILYGDSA